MDENGAHPAGDRSEKKGSAGDFFAGLVIFLVGAYALYESVTMPFYGDSGLWGSPGLTPGLIAAVLLLLSAILIVRSIGFSLSDIRFTMTPQAWRGLLTFMLIVAYVAVLPIVGYAPSTFVMLLVFQVLFAKSRNWRFLLIWAVGLSAALTAALYYLFAEIFLIPLP